MSFLLLVSYIAKFTMSLSKYVENIFHQLEYRSVVYLDIDSMFYIISFFNFRLFFDSYLLSNCKICAFDFTFVEHFILLR